MLCRFSDTKGLRKITNNVVEDRLETPLVRDTKCVSHLTSLRDVEGSPPLWSCLPQKLI